jgi:hypothetical protein
MMVLKTVKNELKWKNVLFNIREMINIVSPI